jgi:inositol transporter-like SP family MFS transporter
VFYCGWNLLANTFGQFQTFMLVKAHATQTFATGAGIVLNVVCLIVAALFSKIAGGKNRNVAFIAGIIIMIAALVGLANSGSSLYLIVAWIALQNVGSTSAGESMYKVWTQESFPDGVRAGVQGFINGFSRLLCALFALITPTLVLPENIKTTMIGFAGLIFVAGLFGLNQMRLQKKYHVGRN